MKKDRKNTLSARLPDQKITHSVRLVSEAFQDFYVNKEITLLLRFSVTGVYFSDPICNTFVMQLYEFLSELNRTEKYRGMTICPPKNFETVYALSAVNITFRKLDENCRISKGQNSHCSLPFVDN
jgi:hypothetical protein